MADYLSKTAELQGDSNINTSGERLDSLIAGGSLQCATFEFTASENVSSGSTILLCKLPQAVRVLEVCLYSDGLSGTTVNVGHDSFRISSTEGPTLKSKNANAFVIGESLAQSQTASSTFDDREVTRPNVAFRGIESIPVIATINGSGLVKDKTIYGFIVYMAL